MQLIGYIHANCTDNCQNCSNIAAGIDYQEVELVLRFGPGLSDRQCFSVSVFEDETLEDQEGFILMIQLTNGSNASIVGQNSTVFIQDNECECMCVDSYIKECILDS